MTAVLRLGVIGLGRAFTLMLPTFLQDHRVRLVAAFDPRPEARACFAEDFKATAHESAESLCADPAVQAVYIASPHALHVEHVRIAAAHGKHVLVEKPMALTIADCHSMIEATRAAGIHLLVGHSHSFDRPYLRTRDLIASGEFGRLRMITAINFTDFLYRPRRPEELDTSQGGGVVFSQAAHQVDVVRLLVNRPATSVRAFTGDWDSTRPTEGAYSAQIWFGTEIVASLTYSGYGHFDTDEFNGWIGELGHRRDPDAYGAARRQLQTVTTAEQEIALKNQRSYGPATSSAFAGSRPAGHNHFGMVLVTCEKADLRPLPNGVMIYSNDRRSLDPLPAPDVPRQEVIDELHAAVVHNIPPLHSGEWSVANLEICLAMLRSKTNASEVYI